jgi:hypothetical protein
MNLLRSAKRLLRSPRVIVGEIAALAVLGVIGAALPQDGVAPLAELERFRSGGPLWTTVLHGLALDHIFRSVGFVALTVLASGSLVVVLWEQLRRARNQWTLRLTPAHFQSAPFHVEFDRSANRPGGDSLVGRYHPSSAQSSSLELVWTENRLGLLGSPLFHAGLLLVIVAACWRALFGAEAGVDLLEGDTLAPTAQAWAVQWRGPLASPFHLSVPMTLKSVHATRYESGQLQGLKVRVSVHRPEGLRETEIAVNRDSHAAGARVFLSSGFGPAALLEWQPHNAAATREAVLLESRGGGIFESAAAGPDGERAYLRAQVDAYGNPPDSVEVRVMKEGALLAVADARPGETISLPSGTRLALRGTPFWARFRGNRDSALWLAYAGFALALIGATLIFTVIRVDGCVVVIPLGDHEHVFVALKPQRFAPLFEERFQRMVEREQGQGSPRPHATPEAGARGDARPPMVRLPRMMRARPVGWLFLVLGTTFLTSCGRSSKEQARALVERYNQVVSEAYRRGDVRLIDPVVGPKEGKKLTGLIGVRNDFGITLDSHLLSLEVTGVEQAKNAMRVSTTERWRYRDLRIGSGKQVGEESLDAYEMLYFFTNRDRAWVVDEIRFAKPPRIGRSQAAWTTDRQASFSQAGSLPAPETAHP